MGQLAFRMGGLVLACLSVGLLPALAKGEPPSPVVLIESPEPTPLERETLTRAEAELKTYGFTVVRAGRGKADVRTSLEDAARNAHAMAAIAVEDGASLGQVEIWVIDRLTGKTSIRPVDVGTEDRTPAVVAVKAIELLRASLLETVHPPESDSVPPTPPSPVSALAGAAPKSERFGVFAELGAAALVHLDPPTPRFAPVARLTLRWPIGLGGRITWMGPGLGPDVDAPLGKAAFHEELALAEVVFNRPVSARLELSVAAGVGVQRLDASGETTNPAKDRSGGATSAFFSIAAGTSLRLSDRFAWSTELLGGVSAPRVVLDMAGESFSAIGRPVLGLTTGLRGRFQ